MHAMLAAAFVSTGAIFFGVAFFLLRKTRIGIGRLSEPFATFCALVSTMLAAFAIVELTKFGLDWKAEFAELGTGVLLGLGLVSLASIAAAGWLVRRSRRGVSGTGRPSLAFPQGLAISSRRV